MNGARQLPARDYSRLKAAFRDLVEAAGGAVRAARITRVGHGQISQYGSPDYSAFAPADVVADLEAEVGNPIVTRVQAELQGFSLVPLAAPTSTAEIIHHVGTVSREVSEAIDAATQALASGDLPRRRDIVVTEITQAEQALASFKADVKRIESVVPLVPRRVDRSV